MHLWGRESELAALTESYAGLTLVVGDPGTGKSGLLLAAREATADAVSPPVVSLARRAGSLQQAVLESLAAATVDIAQNEGSFTRLSRVLTESVDRLAEARLRDLSKAGVALLFGIVTDRLGATAGGLVRDFVLQVGESHRHRLEARIAAASDRDVLSVLIGLLAEVQVYADAPVVVSLDNLELLGEDDLRMLLDLVDNLPRGVHLRAAHSTPDAVAASRVVDLRAAGAACVELSGLDLSVVAYWLASEQIPQSDLDLIMRVTNGVPLFVDAAIAHVRTRGQLRDLPLDESFDYQTRRAFGQLGIEEQRACALLAAMSEPPSLRTLTALLDCSEADFYVIERRLIEARLLSAHINERPWFHELRRRSLWRQSLSDGERREAANRVVDCLMTEIDSEGSVTPQVALELSRLAMYSEPLRASTDVEAVLALNGDELAIFASLLELGVPGDEGAADADAVLSHAREVFGAKGDLVTSLRSLADRELIVMAENNHAAVAIECLGSREAMYVCWGRAIDDLARVPIPELASAVFHSTVEPAVAPFYQARFGVGRPGLTTLGEMLKQMQTHRDGDVISWRKHPGVLVRARIADVPFYASIGFDTVDDRNEALGNLQGVRSHALGVPLSITTAEAWPHEEPLAEQRFVNAGELLLGWRPQRRGTQRQDEREVESTEEELKLTVMLRSALATLCTATERQALGLDQSLGFLFHEHGAGRVICEVTGLPGVVKVDADALPFGPFYRFAVAEAALLGRHQRIGTIHYSSGGKAKDPLVPLLVKTAQDFRAFNKSQGLATGRPRRRVVLDQEHLEVELAQALERASKDATALLDSGAIEPGRDFTPYRTVYALIRVPEREEHLLYGARGMVTVVRKPAPSANTLHLRVETGLKGDLGFGNWADMADAFGLDDSPSVGWSSGELRGQLSDWLGYDRESLQFVEA